MTRPRSEPRELVFTPLPIQVACPVPITPDGRTLDAGGEPLPREERTARCAVFAHWMVGAQVSCDCHTLLLCEAMEIDFDGLVEEAGRDVAAARVPWAERKRDTQEAAEQTEAISRRTA